MGVSVSELIANIRYVIAIYDKGGMTAELALRSIKLLIGANNGD